MRPALGHLRLGSGRACWVSDFPSSAQSLFERAGPAGYRPYCVHKIIISCKSWGSWLVRNWLAYMWDQSEPCQLWLGCVAVILEL